MKSPDSQPLLTASPRSKSYRLHLRHHATEIHENKNNVRQLINPSQESDAPPALNALPAPQHTIDNIRNFFTMITTNQPINGGTTSRKESAPQTDILQYFTSSPTK